MTAYYIKTGVNFQNVQPLVLEALSKIADIYESYGVHCWVTSANDGIHHGKPVKGDDKDPHYCGKALDLRTHHIPSDHKPLLVEAIKTLLGEEWFVQLEFPGADNEHLHIQLGHVST